jgi:hypothetical protein
MARARVARMSGQAPLAATWVASRVASSPFRGEWRCYACGEPLAMGNRFGRAIVDARLIEIGTAIDGLVTFGLPDKYRIVERPRIPRGGRYAGSHKLPLAIYCPRPGVCGRAQQLRPVLDSP